MMVKFLYTCEICGWSGEEKELAMYSSLHDEYGTPSSESACPRCFEDADLIDESWQNLNVEIIYDSKES